MASTEYRNGYGQIEPNRCSFLRDGNIESQCKYVAEAVHDVYPVLENGAIVAVNKAKKEVRKAENFTTGLLGLNYTAERIYDERTPGRKNFAVKVGEYPRVGYLKSGDVFTTNVMIPATSTDLKFLAGATSIEDAKAKITAGSAYWTAPTVVSTSAPVSGLKMQVVELTDTADGQMALKIQVL